MANKSMKGMGDLVAKITHAFKLDEVAQYVARLRGKEDCGCERRQEMLNELIPFKSKKMEKYKISCDLLDSMVEELAAKIDTKPEFIAGIPRGGAIIGVMLSHKTGIPYIELNEIQHFPKEDVLIVDDIADSGVTLSHYTGYKTATVHHKPQSIVEPTYYVETIDNNMWIVYPFEKPEADTIQDYRTK